MGCSLRQLVGASHRHWTKRQRYGLAHLARIYGIPNSLFWKFVTGSCVFSLLFLSGLLVYFSFFLFQFFFIKKLFQKNVQDFQKMFVFSKYLFRVSKFGHIFQNLFTNAKKCLGFFKKCSCIINLFTNSKYIWEFSKIVHVWKKLPNFQKVWNFKKCSCFS